MRIALTRRAEVHITSPLLGSRAIRVADMRIRFRIKLSSLSESRNSTLSISNLREETVASITRGARIVLYAGYNRGPYGAIYTGIAADVEQDDETLERDVTITLTQTGQGGQGATTAPVDGRFRGDGQHPFWPAETQLRTIFRDHAQLLGYELAANSDIPNEPIGIVWQVANNTKLSLDGLARRHNRTWWADGERIIVGRYRRPMTSVARITLAERTGMIGIPAYTDDGFTGKALLSGLAKPGGQVTVQSRRVRGTFALVEVDHIGDSWGAKWETVMRGAHLLPASVGGGSLVL